MFLALAGALVIVGGCVYSGYNRAVTLEENVKGAWSQVENQLQRRFDLVPNLVETVKGYASHEEKIFTNIAESRQAYFQAKDKGSVSGMAKAATGFESALSRLLVLRESYPDLKANESFNNLMVAIEGSENRLAVERKRYNDAVRQLNTFTRRLLGRFYSSLAGVAPAEYFEAPEEAKTAPKVDFSRNSEDTGRSRDEVPQGGDDGG
ncbi:MAG: LemA family protein [Phycisphaerae bacterium]|nr:LemA family protein [Phycisphaerae bacterium]